MKGRRIGRISFEQSRATRKKKEKKEEFVFSFTYHVNVYKKNHSPTRTSKVI